MRLPTRTTSQEIVAQISVIDDEIAFLDVKIDKAKKRLIFLLGKKDKHVEITVLEGRITRIRDNIRDLYSQRKNLLKQLKKEISNVL